MAVVTQINGDAIITGNLHLNGDITPARTRTDILAVTELAVFTVPMSIWREHDDYATVLDGTPVADNHLGCVGGTFGTNVPSLQTDDFGENGGVSHYYARGEIALPWNYVSANTVTIRVHAGMLTAVGDQSCTVDLQVYESDKDSTSTGDICATEEAQNMNSLVFADFDFSITATNLVAGDLLDVLIDVAADDDGTAVCTGCIGAVQLLCDVK